MLPIFLTFGNIISDFISLVSNSLISLSYQQQQQVSTFLKGLDVFDQTNIPLERICYECSGMTPRSQTRLNHSRSGLAGGEILSSMSNRSSNKKLKGNKSQGKDIETFESTISCDKKEKKESTESINKCKEIDLEELKRILELKKTTTARCSMIKKGQHNKAILIGMGLQINNNSDRSSTKEESSVSHNRFATNYGRSSTKEESLVSDDKITTSSSMSSTRKESTQTGTHFDSIIKYTPNKSDILKRDASAHISINTVTNK